MRYRNSYLTQKQNGMKHFSPAIFLLLFILTACRRDAGNPPSQSGCYRTGFIFQPLGETTSLRTQLDDSGRVKLVMKNASPVTVVRRFDYADRTILVANGASNTPDTVVLNSAGLVVSRRWSDATDYRLFEQYEYDGEEVQRRVSGYSRGGTLYGADTLRYFWRDGNMVRTEDGDDTTYYEHYNDRLLSIAGSDIIGIEASLTYGIPIIRNKNLVKSWRSSGEAVEVHYSYSSDARVLSAEFTEKVSGKTGLLDYIVSCY